MFEYHINALNKALRVLAESPYLPAATGFLAEHAAVIDRELGKTVIDEIPAFTESGNPDVLPDLARHGPQHTAEILRLLGGGSVGEFEFVQEHARRRAEQHFPLEATLHAYRCGHKVLSRWVREAMLSAAASAADAPQLIAAVADFALEYTDAISTIATGSYLSHTRLLAEVAGDQRAELLSILLEGYDESDGRVAKILRGAGYLDRRQAFCIALAQPVDPAEMLNPARARRLADSIDKTMQGSSPRRLIDLRQNRVTIVCSDTRRASGWTAPHSALAMRVAADLSTLGNAVIVGISNDVPSTSQIPTAYKEALLALELADVSNRVVQYSAIPLRRLMLHLAGEELQRLLPGWSDEFFRADDKAGGILVATLRAYANADMNVLHAAKILSVHPNTMYSRFQKIRDITGFDPRSYNTLNELLIVADCRRPAAAGRTA